jgi:hypothetical protein
MIPPAATSVRVYVTAAFPVAGAECVAGVADHVIEGVAPTVAAKAGGERLADD